MKQNLIQENTTTTTPTETSLPEKSYFTERIELLGLTEEINNINVNDRDGNIYKSSFLQEIKEGIRINYFSPSGMVCKYENGTGKKLLDYYRIRYSKPVKNKYFQPAGSGVYPYITPGLIKKFKSEEKFKTLVIVEGELKAISGDSNGLDIIGIPGIYSYKEKGSIAIHDFIIEIINKCSVKNIILLFDADCMKVEYDAEKDLHKRLHNFYNAVIKFREDTKPLNVDVYFSHIKEDYQETAKGLDDLFCLKQKNTKQIIDELLLHGSIKNPEYFECINLATSAASKIKEHFHIDDVKSFQKHYTNVINDREFIYKGNTYGLIDGKLKVSWYGQAPLFLRVGKDFFKYVLDKNKHGQYEKYIKEWSIAAINTDYNNNREFIRQIPKYDMFCNKPDNSDKFQQVFVYENAGITSKLYNRYIRIDHNLKKGNFETINNFLRHIFSEKNSLGETLFEFVLDYIQLLYTKPDQKLPILCPVSKERNTGKTTFLLFLKLIFGDNMAILDNARFDKKFTSHYAEKLIIAVDETSMQTERKEVSEYIKYLSTTPTVWLEAKGKSAQSIDFYGKLIFASNNETNFVSIDTEENRYCVFRVPKLQNDDTKILEKLKNELPAFLYHLANERALHYSIDNGRFSFAEAIYTTAATQNVKERSKSGIQKELEEFIKNSFLKFGKQELFYAAQDIAEELNKTLQFKTGATTIRDYLKHDRGMTIETYMRYPVYVTHYMPNEDKDVVSKGDSKTGTPFRFYYKDWLTQNDVETNGAKFTE
jgi:hypothetical protein